MRLEPWAPDFRSLKRKSRYPQAFCCFSVGLLFCPQSSVDGFLKLDHTDGYRNLAAHATNPPVPRTTANAIKMAVPATTRANASIVSDISMHPTTLAAVNYTRWMHQSRPQSPRHPCWQPKRGRRQRYDYGRRQWVPGRGIERYISVPYELFLL